MSATLFSEARKGGMLMGNELPSNEDVISFGQAIAWQEIEKYKKAFNKAVKQLRDELTSDEVPLEILEERVGIPIKTYHDDPELGNAIMGVVNDQPFVLGSYVSQRYRYGKTILKAIIPYNFNPSVNHTNLSDTEQPITKMRALGAELELGLFRPDGTAPTDEEVSEFANLYRNYAHRLGITPQVDREACVYQVEVHVAPGIGYHRTRKSIDGIMQSLVAASNATGLNTAIMSAFPLHSDFELTDDPKVHTAVDVMVEINNRFPEYDEKIRTAKDRYGISHDSNVVQVFRLQGCHIHIDIAGRSEALGLFTFATMLRSATAIANAAVLKGGPFVNGTCDPEYICTREYLRSTTVTGRYLDVPVSPHLSANGLVRYSELLKNDRANHPARALLVEGGLGEDISVMHNPIGRVRPDLGMSKRICTIESTGMPVNISASRQAAVLSDFEFTHILIENYYREHGLDMRAMQADETLWAILGPLSGENYTQQQDNSDREGTDILVETATGKKMTLPEFYEMKRMYLHRHLVDVPSISPRDIDDVYTSLNRMLAPPSGRVAETVEHYIADPTRRSTGNWGKILRNAFIEEGGTPGEFNPEAVLRVANRVHNALVERYS